jgi:hypothetical protein
MANSTLHLLKAGGGLSYSTLFYFSATTLRIFPTIIAISSLDNFLSSSAF